ncbi:hypothetical protein ACTXJE_15860 [Glutamicibacter ardleyensis]
MRTHQEDVLQKELTIPRYAGKKKEWPTGKAKSRKRKNLRTQLAREAQQLIDKNTMKGVV